MSNAAKPWLIIRCTSGQEGRAERYLERMGYPHGWHPTEKVRISEAIYQRMLLAAKKLPTGAQSRKPARYKVKTIVTGYVFLPAPEVKIHEINGHHPRVWMEVLSVNDKPYRLSDAIMAEMRETPQRVRDLVEAAEKARQAEWEAKMPVVGEEACVMAGPFQGNCGIVHSKAHGQVEVDIGALIGRVKLPEGMVQRVA